MLPNFGGYKRTKKIFKEVMGVFKYFRLFIHFRHFDSKHLLLTCTESGKVKDLGVSAPPLLVFGCHRGLVLSRFCQPGDLLLARVDEVSGGDGFDVGRLPAVLAPGPVPQLKRGDPSARLRLPLQQVGGGLAAARARREVSEAGLACMSNLHKRLILVNNAKGVRLMTT